MSLFCPCLINLNNVTFSRSGNFPCLASKASWFSSYYLAGVSPSLCRVVFLYHLLKRIFPRTWSGVSLYFPPTPGVLIYFYGFKPHGFLGVPMFGLEPSSPLSSGLARSPVYLAPQTPHGSPPTLSVLRLFFVFHMQVSGPSIHPAVQVLKLPHSFNHQLLSFPPSEYILDPSTSFSFHSDVTTLVSAT